MEKKVFMEKLFSNRREKLVDLCLHLHNTGKDFIYILPSSTALQDVRKRFFRVNNGLLGSRVIVFDDLEMDIVNDYVNSDSIIYSPLDRVIISEICSENRYRFRYYSNIYDRKGLHDEISRFIRVLKRSCINEDKISQIMDSLTDEVLKDKLHDLSLIYSVYNRILKNNGLYDRNDVSMKAVEESSYYRGLENIDSIIIDGFTDIETVSMKLIENIARTSKANMYVNCPYNNALMKDFLYSEIQKPFKDMGFEIVTSDGDAIEISPGIKELCEKLYSRDRMCIPLEEVIISRYPCIEAEVRSIGRDIKKRIIEGLKPENIAVYVNNRDAYSRHIAEIFDEFNIPVSLAFELPLSSSEMVREIIKSMENLSGDKLPLYSYLEKLSAIIEDKKLVMELLVERIINSTISPEEILEMKAFDSLHGFLLEIKSSFEKSGIVNEHIDKDYLQELLYDSIKKNMIVIRQGNNRGVKILDTALAKGVYYSHVYILGLNEGEVPSSPESAGLFDRFEIKQLSEKGIRYNDYYWELNREKIRFNLALASGTRSISLSYRSADEDGKYAIPSSFIDEVKFISGIENIENVTMRDRFNLYPDNASSKGELISSIAKNIFEDKYRNRKPSIEEGEIVFATAMAEKIEDVMKNGRIEYHRERERNFNNYEGIMDGDFNETALTLCTFTPSALSTYVSCPFKYMMDYLFKAGEEDEKEGEYSVIEIGNLYHDVLYSYYKNAGQFEKLDTELFNEIFQDTFCQLRHIDVNEEMLALLNEGYSNILQNFIICDIARMEAFEKTTGNVIRPYMLEKFMENESIFGVNMRCVIDRVDMEYERTNGRLSPTGRYIIYDYKKKSIDGINEVLENKSYQLPIYYHLIHSEIVKVFGNKAECMGLLYLSIEKTSDSIEKDGVYKTEYKKALDLGTKRSDVNGDKFDLLMDYVKGLIMDTIDSIKSGVFNYKVMCGNFEGYNSYGCRYENICRYSKSKARVVLGK